MSDKHIKVRRLWTRSPAEQVQPNLKKQPRRKNERKLRDEALDELDEINDD